MKVLSKKRRNVYAFFISFILVLVLSGGIYFTVFFDFFDENGRVNDGKISISNIENDIIYLNGEWKFEWGEFLDIDSVDEIDEIQSVPGMWTNYITESGEKYPAYGHATFAVNIEDASKGEHYTFRMPTFGTSAKVFVNDTLIYEVGKIADSKDDYSPKMMVKYIDFIAPDNNFNLVIQVANYDYARGGIWQPITIGTKDNMEDYKLFRNAYENFVLGMLFIMFIVSIILIFIRKNNQLLYSFSMAIILVVLYHITNGDKIIVRWFSGISMAAIVKTQYIVMYLLPVVCFSYLNYINTNKKIKIAFNILAIQSIVMTLFTIIAPISWVTRTTYYANTLAYIIIIIYCLGLINFVMKGNKEAIILFISGLVLGICSIHDMLYGATIIEGRTEIISVGFLISIFVMGLLALDSIVKDLENAQLSKLYQQAYLNAQITPHFLFNALNTIVSVIERNPKKAEELICHLSVFLRSTIDSNNLNDVISLSKEVENTKSYLKIEEVRFANIKFVFDINDEENVKIPPMTLQPLVENAIKHGLRKKKDGGIVEIYGEKIGADYVVSVCDNGVGMDDEKLLLLKQKIERNDLRNAFTSSSIGLVNVCMRASRILDAKVDIDSKKDVGTKIELRIPIKIKGIKQYIPVNE